MVSPHHNDWDRFVVFHRQVALLKPILEAVNYTLRIVCMVSMTCGLGEDSIWWASGH